MSFDEKTISELSGRVKARLSEKRFKHTLGVEFAAIRLGELILPDQINELRCAALLHDIAKEYTTDKLIDLIQNNGYVLSDEDMKCVSVLHSFAAPIIIKRDFPEFATVKILSATEKHTTGDDGMSVFDEIIFLSDYIEDGREYDDCIEVRNYFYSNVIEGEYLNNERILHVSSLLSIEKTVSKLKETKRPINARTLNASGYLKNLIKNQ